MREKWCKRDELARRWTAGVRESAAKNRANHWKETMPRHGATAGGRHIGALLAEDHSSSPLVLDEAGTG